MSNTARALLIDGSNVVHALYEPWLPVEDSRADGASGGGLSSPAGRGGIRGHEADLLRSLSDWAAREPGLEIEVVFDGGWRRLEGGDGRLGRGPRRDDRAGGGAASGVRVLFAEDRSADALLLERVRALRYGRRRVSVVTRDRELAETLRAEEAKVVSPERLRSWLAEIPGR